jgi:four helix bundle protein
MPQDENPKRFDLEDRTFAFAKNCRAFIKKLSTTTGNFEDAPQLIRSSGSVGANYIEANEALSKKDFILRIKICRKEAKESRYLASAAGSRRESRQRTRSTCPGGAGTDEYFRLNHSQV